MSPTGRSLCCALLLQVGPVTKHVYRPLTFAQPRLLEGKREKTDADCESGILTITFTLATR